MSWMGVHYECCDSGSSGDATLAKQDEILAALAAIQVDTDVIELCVDEIKTSVVQPELC